MLFFWLYTSPSNAFQPFKIWHPKESRVPWLMATRALWDGNLNNLQENESNYKTVIVILAPLFPLRRCKRWLSELNGWVQTLLKHGSQSMHTQTKLCTKWRRVRLNVIEIALQTWRWAPALELLTSLGLCFRNSIARPVTNYFHKQTTTKKADCTTVIKTK